MKKAIAGVALGIAMMAVPVLAQSTQPTKDQLVCKYEKKTNSRFTTKICHTRAQWTEIAEATKRDYAEQRDRPVIDGRRPE